MISHHHVRLLSSSFTTFSMACHNRLDTIKHQPLTLTMRTSHLFRSSSFSNCINTLSPLHTFSDHDFPRVSHYNTYQITPSTVVFGQPSHSLSPSSDHQKSTFSGMYQFNFLCLIIVFIQNLEELRFITFSA